MRAALFTATLLQRGQAQFIGYLESISELAFITRGQVPAVIVRALSTSIRGARDFFIGPRGTLVRSTLGAPGFYYALFPQAVLIFARSREWESPAITGAGNVIGFHLALIIIGPSSLRG